MSTAQAGEDEGRCLFLDPLWFIVSDKQASVVVAVHPVIPDLQRPLWSKSWKPHWRFNKVQIFTECCETFGFLQDWRSLNREFGKEEFSHGRSGSYLGLGKATNRPRIWQIHSVPFWSAESVEVQSSQEELQQQQQQLLSGLDLVTSWLSEPTAGPFIDVAPWWKTRPVAEALSGTISHFKQVQSDATFILERKREKFQFFLFWRLRGRLFWCWCKLCVCLTCKHEMVWVALISE